jgi:capsule polysaccharide export protein KpsE/RkpR
MVDTEEQQLKEQISRLSSKLRIYKKALTNPNLREDAQIFFGNILWLEAEISDLQAQLEVCQLVSMMFNLVTQPCLHGHGED